MHIHRVRIERFRGIRDLTLHLGRRAVVLGPNNAGKSTILEALDLLLHPGFGRPRQAPTELDYHARAPSGGFVVEAVLGDLSDELCAEVREHLEGWHRGREEVVAEPDGAEIEPILRVLVRGTEDFDTVHEFAKAESAGARLTPRVRAQFGWIFDGRSRDPFRQLSFYQGGLLDRLFSEVNLGPALDGLRSSLDAGATMVNADPQVKPVLDALGDELRALGVPIEVGEPPAFEAGAVSARELLQSLRLGLPTALAHIPIARHGRGVQRLLLIALLLRLARTKHKSIIGAFEEPEEALEPLRQTQVASMLATLATNGQVIVVTQSPEIARAFLVEDFVLLDEGARNATVLRKSLSAPVRQTFERCLDRSIVRAMFAPIPLLVEGPGDRAVIETFWAWRAKQGSDVPPAEHVGVDVVNCEGASFMPMVARLFKEASKTVIAWAETDTPDILARLRGEGHCALLLVHDAERQNLEQSLVWGTTIVALGAALSRMAAERGYTWDQQRSELLTRHQCDAPTRDRLKAVEDIGAFLAVLGDSDARVLVAKALAAKGVTPFEMKGARQARLVAETIIDVDGKLPPSYEKMFAALGGWLGNARREMREISM